MYEAELTVVESSRGVTARTVAGLAPTLPEKGKGFFMYINSKDGKLDRHILTSEVENAMVKNGLIVFTTKNSVYSLEYKKAVCGR